MSRSRAAPRSRRSAPRGAAYARFCFWVMIVVGMLQEDLFQAVEKAVASNSQTAALDLLIDEFREIGRYDLLFEARKMRKRVELGLPLIHDESSLQLTEQDRPAYEQALIEAAREAGRLYLAAGKILAAYRYFRAIGETQLVADAIEKVEAGENLDDVIAIAFQEGVHPRKGLELILHKHGMCRAITVFGSHAVEKDREDCLELLIRELHAEVLERMRRTVEQQEGSAAAGVSLPDLMAGRPWLFGEYDTYVDTSHLTSLIPYCLEVTREQTLRLLDELCDYGRHLSANFAFQGQPPFENGYDDYGHYIQAALRQDEEEHVRYFSEKAAKADPEIAGTAPAQLLVALLARLERYDEALEMFQRYLADENPQYLQCPNALQLCHAAKNYAQMSELAHNRGDVLNYAVALLMVKT
jgi:hypothetical protein